MIIYAEVRGVYFRIFNNFGDSFVVNDRDGNEPAQCFIKNIDFDKNMIYLFKDSENELRTGDYIRLDDNKDFENYKNKKELNNSIHQIKNMCKKT